MKNFTLKLLLFAAFVSFSLSSFSQEGTQVVCDIFSSTTDNLNIPDGNGTTSPSQGTPLFSSITIADDIQNITDINISLNATHDGVSELIFQLQGNSEFTNLWIGNCSGQATIDVTFNDNGSALPGGGTPCGDPITGTYAPESTTTSIAEIFAAGTQGTFDLAVVDFFTGNIGTLNSWEIEICYTQALSTLDFEIENLSIFPNPNNGEFTIGFDSNSGEEVTIKVYDLRGRAIFTERFTSHSRFEEVITLRDAQPGMYLLNIIDGAQKTIKKIIVE